MSVEDFKHQFANELTGLTAARVTTLWKKSKTMSLDETREAITQSKTAQMRDQQRRSGKTADAPAVMHQENAPVVTHQESAPAVMHQESAPVDASTARSRAMPDWSNECKQAEIDLDQLNRAVDILCHMMESRNVPSVEMRILKLYQSVEDLLLLRVKSKNTIDVLSVLSAYAL